MPPQSSSSGIKKLHLAEPVLLTVGQPPPTAAGLQTIGAPKQWRRIVVLRAAYR